MKDTPTLLKKLRVIPQKELGQSFLISSAALDSIVQFGRPRSEEDIVEIGGGMGALTGELLESRSLTVIEIQHEFAKLLATQYPEITVIEQDVREVDLTTLGEEITIFGNLPYSFSSEILFQLLSAREHVRRAILLLQKEFVERLGAEPGTKKYGSLSVITQVTGDVFLGPIIAGDSFYPPVQVESQVVEIRFFKEPRFDLKNSFYFQQVLRAAFFKRRKKIRNSMELSKIFRPVELDRFFSQASISPDVRSETLSVEEYVALGDIMAQVCKEQ